MNALQTLSHARRHGVSPSNLHPLLALMSDPPMGPGEIAEICGVTPGAVTQLIDNLRKLELVEDATTPYDRRKKRITPTEKAFGIFAPIITDIESPE